MVTPETGEGDKPIANMTKRQVAGALEENVKLIHK
jgi:hypothetical protein